ncbi:hypothetical protein [Actinacidiphila acididurans]|uniref:Uncharacterized protein n=1 Tax=Actinacidiphila acididurans TaxID=2784346 RepID=A0ABS2TJ49_9ACTN|nr:hypothetical protein [Actinacidiphila acididurans]MBM9503026.1 hypothetical protein [Actinacidiphila acididurans]
MEGLVVDPVLPLVDDVQAAVRDVGDRCFDRRGLADCSSSRVTAVTMKRAASSPMSVGSSRVPLSA